MPLAAGYTFQIGNSFDRRTFRAKPLNFGARAALSAVLGADKRLSIYVQREVTVINKEFFEFPPTLSALHIALFHGDRGKPEQVAYLPVRKAAIAKVAHIPVKVFEYGFSYEKIGEEAALNDGPRGGLIGVVHVKAIFIYVGVAADII
jgi:hypothetical protein